MSENRSISLRERILAALVACDYDMKGLPWRPFLDEIEIGAYERKADAVLAVLAEEGL